MIKKLEIIRKNILNFKYNTPWKRYDEIDNTIEAKTGEDFLKKEYVFRIANEVVATYGFTEESTGSAVFTEENISDNNRLDKMRQLLSKNNDLKQHHDEIIKGIKEELFKQLTYEDIAEHYFTFLSSLKAYIEKSCAK